ncbi:MAG: D-alanine--D-alanine ligase [Candidatus Cloacimonetes bacterium]|nr:D-alanine--D-alanine ligase [Candidatus Cloacimonadota bacterium]MDY0366914.1 D-alanine--D-alanine ligase [Candidatus Syntrophosphaera sp.]
MERITVLKGGDSPEREVSLVSGAAIANGLRGSGLEVTELDPADFSSLDKLIDRLKELGTGLIFLGLHGGSGENGQLQAALDLAGLRYTGSGFQACALTMDKYVAKLLAREEGVPVADWVLLRGDQLGDYEDPRDLQGIVDKLGLPLIVKPNAGGSSVGISKVETTDQLREATQQALKYSSSALLERFIPGRELTVTVLDGTALPVVEIKPLSGWYDYANKYKAGRSEYLAPAPIEEAVAQLIQMYAARLWQVFGLRSYARIDFRYDGDQPYFLEVNTLPGMTPLSLTPMAAKAVGISFADLVVKIAHLALNQDETEES